MRVEYMPLTQKLKEEDVYPDGANSPTRVTAYICPCGEGTVEYHRVVGFGDEYTVIRCPACEKTYSLIDLCGSQWKCYRYED